MLKIPFRPEVSGRKGIFSFLAIMNNETYFISTEKSKLNIGMIHSFLSGESYWAKGIPEETVRRSIENSICFGVYYGTQQVGFARVSSDCATFAYLADVFILPAHRGHGLSKMLMETIFAHEDLQGLRRWLLGTADAHGLYSKYGFTPLAKPARMMEKHNANVYGSRIS
ncbi:GNAT family N-acetyltransferase [soil metagenome]